MYLLKDVNYENFLTEINAVKGVVTEENFKYAIQFNNVEDAIFFKNAINQCYESDFIVVEVNFETIREK